MILLEYNFATGKYDTTLLKQDIDSPLEKTEEQIQDYLSLRIYRDILLDFEHRNAIIYNISNPKLINQLVSYGRIILL